MVDEVTLEGASPGPGGVGSRGPKGESDIDSLQVSTWPYRALRSVDLVGGPFLSPSSRPEVGPTAALDRLAGACLRCGGRLLLNHGSLYGNESEDWVHGDTGGVKIY